MIAYLTAIMDLFSRKVIGYKVVDCLSASPAIELFKTAFEERGCPTGLMFHSDQGGQFTAYRFRVLLRGKKVKQSFSSPGNPYDNAVIESFFRTLKTEQIYVNTYKTLSELSESIDEYMHFYNEVRPHQKLHNLTPNEFELKYYQQNR